MVEKRALLSPSARLEYGWRRPKFSNGRTRGNSRIMLLLLLLSRFFAQQHMQIPLFNELMSVSISELVR